MLKLNTIQKKKKKQNGILARRPFKYMTENYQLTYLWTHLSSHYTLPLFSDSCLFSPAGNVQQWHCMDASMCCAVYDRTVSSWRERERERERERPKSQRFSRALAVSMQVGWEFSSWLTAQWSSRWVVSHAFSVACFDFCFSADCVARKRRSTLCSRQFCIIVMGQETCQLQEIFGRCNSNKWRETNLPTCLHLATPRTLPPFPLSFFKFIFILFYWMVA